MYFIYSLLLGVAFLILLPRFLIDALRHRKYVNGLGERLGFVTPLPSDGRPVIWIHCVSVGETQAARPLVHALRKQFPQSVLAISTITRTGQNLAQEVFKSDAAKVFYFPFDWRWVVRRTLKAIKPGSVLIMETELWPGFLRECERRDIPVAIVNGRLSEQSFRRYRLIKPFMKRVLRPLQLAIMQTNADAERLVGLGMSADKTFVAGNLKFEVETPPATDRLTTEFRKRFKFTPDTPVILAASTHDPEEVIILNSLLQVFHKSVVRPRLLIAPRHPERFDEVADLLKASGWQWVRRTAEPSPYDAEAEVVLLDTIGELHSVYPLAWLVFVGGSIANTGGHNILEPSAVAVPVIVGAHTFNFKAIVETFVKADAIVQLQPMSDSAAIVELSNIISDLLADPVRRLELGTRARYLVDQNQGATKQTLELLSAILPRGGATQDVDSASPKHFPTA